MLSFVEFVFGGNCYRYSPWIPPWKWTCHLKRDHFKRKIVLQPSFLRGYLSFLGVGVPNTLNFHIFWQCLQERLKNRQTIKARLSVLNVPWRKEHGGTCLIPRFMVTLPVVSKRKGKIFWKPKVEPQFFWVQDNCWHFVLCGCGVDIECLWAHGYNTLKYTTLKHPYYTLSRIDETFSWLFLIYPVILKGARCIFLANDELKNPRLPQKSPGSYQTTPGPKRTLKRKHPCRFASKESQFKKRMEDFGTLEQTPVGILGSVGWWAWASEIQETHAVSVQLSIRKHARTHQKKGRFVGRNLL